MVILLQLNEIRIIKMKILHQEIKLTDYLYGTDGQRAVKRSIFLGTERIVTKQCSKDAREGFAEAGTQSEADQQYYYHADHLGSVSAITDSDGDVYERLEYTPYGEVWIDLQYGTTAFDFDTPYRFTGKELDEETGLYYYGARYLDPRYSVWKSADPALGEYIPRAPIDDDSKKYNQNLPGMGGVFNVANLHLYHYAGNNPVRYLDPDGRKTTILIIHANSGWEKIVNGSHVAVHFSNPGNGSDGERLQQTLYDPSGSYVADNGFGTGKYRPSSGVFTGDIPADLSSYINSVLDRENGEYITAYTIDTTPEEEAKMVEKAMENGD